MAMGGDFAQAESGHTVRSLLAILRRRKGIILSCVLFVTAATAVVAAMLPHSYVAELMVILDTRRPAIVQQPAVLSNLVSGSPADPAIVRSEVAVIGSPAFARRVIERLDLLHDRKFMAEVAAKGWKDRVWQAWDFVAHPA